MPHIASTVTRLPRQDEKPTFRTTERAVGIGFEEAQKIFKHPYYLDQRSDMPKQYRAIGWVGEKLYALIFEVREDNDGEYYHLVTLWKATTQEQQLYEEHS